MREATSTAVLEDDRREVFLDRATSVDVDEDTWLDGIAGHLVGNRPAEWTDRTIHKLDLEIRIVASNLAKWLTLAQTAQGSGADLKRVLVVGICGTGRMVVFREPAPNGSLASRMGAVRQALQKNPNATEALSCLLEERMDTVTSLECTQ